MSQWEGRLSFTSFPSTQKDLVIKRNQDEMTWCLSLDLQICLLYAAWQIWFILPFDHERELKNGDVFEAPLTVLCLLQWTCFYMRSYIVFHPTIFSTIFLSPLCDILSNTYTQKHMLLHKHTATGHSATSPRCSHAVYTHKLCRHCTLMPQSLKQWPAKRLMWFIAM